MPKFREKALPVVAVRFTGENYQECWDALGPVGIYKQIDVTGKEDLIIKTACGDINVVMPGHWVVADKLRKGIFTTMWPGSFEDRYELIEE